MQLIYMIHCLVSLSIFLFGCGNSGSDKNLQESKSGTTNTIQTLESYNYDSSFFSRVYFTRPDAEKILGEKAYLSDSSSTVKNGLLQISVAYTAYSKDQQSGNTGSIYFMIEEYKNDSSAIKAYHFIKVGNENHEGVKIIDNMGDEAYYHSDGNNFYFFLVRKRNRMFRIKVNKITSHTSLKEFNLVSKTISDNL
jgi:hypothetical protein